MAVGLAVGSIETSRWQPKKKNPTYTCSCLAGGHRGWRRPGQRWAHGGKVVVQEGVGDGVHCRSGLLVRGIVCEDGRLVHGVTVGASVVGVDIQRIGVEREGGIVCMRPCSEEEGCSCEIVFGGQHKERIGPVGFPRGACEQ